MNATANLFLILGLFGIFASTIGCVGLAWFMKSPLRSERIKENILPQVDVLIPAYNEEMTILRTLRSLSKVNGEFLGRIVIGLDHCTDRTLEFVQQWQRHEQADFVETLLNPMEPGKWEMLRHLVDASSADWVALVDAGSVWDPDLLLHARAAFVDEQVIGIAPSYSISNKTLMERLTWKIERFLKRIESDAGGPVTVHGATVIYRRDVLKEVLRLLDSSLWLNDDVVIPLMMRMRWPERRIVYLDRFHQDAYVTDFGVKSGTVAEMRRRRRILFGNLQWIRSLYFRSWGGDLTVPLIASRRVFRLIWAYWISFILFGVGMKTMIDFHGQNISFVFLSVVMLLIGTLFIASKQGRRLGAAFCVALETPYYFFEMNRTSEEIWN